MRKWINIAAGIFFILSCSNKNERTLPLSKTGIKDSTYIIILGTVQDAGSPQLGCHKSCCDSLWKNPHAPRMVASIGIVDMKANKTFIIDATPDFPQQCDDLNEYAGFEHAPVPDGIFLTHGHIGHYTGLMYLGRESMNAQSTPVYAMPRMKAFLEGNGPWSQLVDLKNVQLEEIHDSVVVSLSNRVSITPFLVPHRDEFSETVGFKIKGPNKTAIYIPDIDKWNKWEKNIVEIIREVDYAIIDGTFYDGEEINNRDISEIPHPFIIESMKVFDGLPANEKNKIWFTHFNHTNPLLLHSSHTTELEEKGYHVAQLHQILNL